MRTAGAAWAQGRNGQEPARQGEGPKFKGKERPPMEVMDRDGVVKSAFRYRNALLSHAFAMLRGWSLAEDTVQDAFIVVMNKWTDFRPGTSLYP